MLLALPAQPPWPSLGSATWGWITPTGAVTPPHQALLSMLTLSEVVMPSMPSPSSCVKNCDATLRRVTLSPLLPAMAAV